MQIISKGYFWFSSLLVIAGMVLIYFLWPFLETPIHELKNYEYGKYVLIFAIGIPLAIFNTIECKFVWGRILKNTKTDLLGISVGLMIGVIIGYCY